MNIIHQYLGTFFCTCIIINTASVQSARPITEGFPLPFIVIDFASKPPDVLLQAIENGCQSFVLTSSTALDFMDQFRYVHDRAIARYPQKRVFIVGNADDNELESGMATILSHSAIDDMLDLLLIRPNASGRVDLLTNFLATTASELTLLDSRNLASRPDTEPLQDRVNLFPNKRRDLRGRDMRLAIFNYQPYTVWRMLAEGAESAGQQQQANAYFNHRRVLYVDGTEARLMIEFCAKFNCKLEVSVDDVGEWGQTFPNRTGDGVLGAVVERRADIGVGALYSWFLEFEFLALSKPISRTGVTCVMPKPLQLSSWMTPILPFSPVLWSAVIATFLVATIFEILINAAAPRITMAKRSSQVGHGRVDVCESVMVVMSIFILQTVLLRINKNRFVSQMILIGSLLMVGLMIGNAYSGGLSSVMTVPRFEKSIDTVQDLADSDLRWGSTHDAWIFSIQLATQPTIVKLLETFITYPKDELHRHAQQRDMGFTIERLPYGHFAVGEYITKDVVESFEIMVDDIYWENCVAMATKTWPLMNEFDELTLAVFESGIQRYWEAKVVSKFGDNKVQHAIVSSRKFDNPGPIALQPSHLLGALFLLVIGLALGLVSFLVELLWHRIESSP
ncbi:uncharacterized protein LOC128274994 [Anopheles cruzii]|uniref:uncharacterized protein LOC128274994 n=1 Tax=Anopheles cruzii TaxID=68878 RepID=UPI0022EC19A7|nr:uncharacterized protein LOC128274994 [Anopheles cruzii]